MLRRFKPLKTVNLQAFDKFNQDLSDVLDELDAGNIISRETYSVSMYKHFLESLVTGQRDSLGHTKPGSWSIVPNDDYMDSDARVEYIFTPTYLVTAILGRTLCEYPILALSIPNYEQALKQGMLFCSYRNLSGHGYDMARGKAKALSILALGKIPWLLERHKKFCPELYRVIREVTKEMKERLDTGTARDAWGGDLQEEFNDALVTLSIKNDQELYETIITTDENSELYHEEDLKW